MPPIPGMMHWHSLLARHVKSLKGALDKGLKALDVQLAQSSGQQRAALEPILARTTPKQPLHPLARIRQSQSRWYSTARKSLDQSVRHFTSATGKSGVKYDRASFPKSTVGNYVRSSTGRAPFASTLRPNLTGGTLGRTAGGYTAGSGKIGGARFFSHSPASQAQVVQNVSQAVRAFFVSGQKAQFDGITANGDKRFKAVSALQEETGRKMRSLPKATPGSWIDFQVNPTITALASPLKSVAGYHMGESTAHSNHLNSDGLLDVLSVDFSRALKDLAAVLNDLNRLSALGDLPITYEGSHLRVHFPGCDSASVERLCDELNIRRGTVIQDDAFDAFVGTDIALLFPFAPSEASLADDSDGSDLYEIKGPAMAPERHVISLEDMLSAFESPAYSTQSETGWEDVLNDDKPWLSSPSGYHQSVRSGSVSRSDKYGPLEYQGFEGIYRFIEQLDAVQR